MKKKNETFFDDEMSVGGEIIPLISFSEGKELDIKLNSGDTLPILPLRNMVLYPDVLTPITLTRSKSLRLMRSVEKKNGIFGVCTQKNQATEYPTADQLYQTGTAARLIKILETQNGIHVAIVEGLKRFKIDQIVSEKPMIKASVHYIDEQIPENEKDEQFVGLVASVRETAIEIIELSDVMPQEMSFTVRNMENANAMFNYLLNNFKIEVADKQRLLEMDIVAERGYALLEILNKESQLLEIKMSIQDKAKRDINQQQREYFLQQQMITIQNELGENSPEDEISEYKKRAKKKKWSKEVGEVFDKELKKLSRTNQHSPEYSTQLNYIETVLDLPWEKYTKDVFNLSLAEKTLNKDHFGMDHVKERILEHLAVLKLKGNLKSPIICLYGPPGVGKTSLGKSIAAALSRKYIRMSLGGIHDEAEIRGHRRTYIGAMPGRIIQNIKKCETSNPVFILDEIDKINSDHTGDPSSALLEVLDPEQNFAFHDNFLDLDYDLSKVLFVATANNINAIPRPLLDRMELIEVTGYTQEEKVEIGQRHLVKKELENHGLTVKQLSIPKKIMGEIVDKYTRESGVRELNRQIAKLMRKVAKNVATETDYNVKLNATDLETYLGKPRYNRDKYEGNEHIGVVTGLAWTSVGGEILFIEASTGKSKSPSLTLTGNLGDVMKESAILGLQYLKANAEEYGIPQTLLDENSVHVHVPEGAIPKDGPSAGITMTTAILSAFTQRRIKKGVAMTGEMTLRGKVLPVGGIKEKILAAKRAGIKEIILSSENQKDVEEIGEKYLTGLKFHFVHNISEVLDIALLKGQM